MKRFKQVLDLAHLVFDQSLVSRPKVGTLLCRFLPRKPYLCAAVLKPGVWYRYTYRYTPEGSESRWDECDGDQVVIVREGNWKPESEE